MDHPSREAEPLPFHDMSAAVDIAACTALHAGTAAAALPLRTLAEAPLPQQSFGAVLGEGAQVLRAPGESEECLDLDRLLAQLW